MNENYMNIIAHKDDRYMESLYENAGTTICS